jgi:hypothetical protein
MTNSHNLMTVQVMQCGMCKTFHLEAGAPCPVCQAHKVHQLSADRCHYPAALRQAAERLRRKAEQMEREASAFEAPASGAAEPPAGELTRRSA